MASNAPLPPPPLSLNRVKPKPNEFQNKLHEDLKAVRNDKNLTIKADKTKNYYKVDRERYTNLVHANVTKTYKESNKNEVSDINRKAKEIAENIGLSDRIEQLAEKEVFVTMKDHKQNFENKPTCRLISPTKSELGRVSKEILNRLVQAEIGATGVHLWKSTREVLEWYRQFPGKHDGSFINFDIMEFYPSISEKLIRRAIEHAQQYATVDENEIEIIIHAKRTVIFKEKEPWKKKNNESSFNVTMGSFVGVETCDLVVCYMLSLLQPNTGIPLVYTGTMA